MKAYLLRAILTEAAVRIGDNIIKIKEKDISKYKLGYGFKFDLIASLELIPKIRTGIVNGKIRRGEMILPVFAPKVNEEQIEPIRQIAKLPIAKIIKFHRIKKDLISKIKDKIVKVIRTGNMRVSQ